MYIQHCTRTIPSSFPSSRLHVAAAAGTGQELYGASSHPVRYHRTGGFNTDADGAGGGGGAGARGEPGWEIFG